MRNLGQAMTGVLVAATLLACGDVPEPTPIAEAALQPSLPTQTPCDGPSADPWVGELRDRVLSSDGLSQYAAELFGPALTCEGAVTAEFDGADFGYVTLGFAQSASLRVESMPPQTNVVTLRSSSGFDDEEAARRALMAYSARREAAIDWTTPTATAADGERRQSFWDPDEGLNASASLIFAGNTLVALRFSMAL